jgi:hypothetical protein
VFGLAVCATLLCANVVSAANAGARFMAFRQGNMHYAEISVNVEGGTSVKMLKDGDTEWSTFDRWDDEFDIDSDMFDNLTDLNNEIAGSYTMEIIHSGGTSQYSFDIQAMQSTWFPANPVLALVPDQIPQQHEFSWTWEGTADAKYVEYSLWTLTEEVDFEQEYLFSDPGFDDKSLLANFGTSVGMADFFVLYTNATDSVIANWTRQLGPDVFNGLSPTEYIASEAMGKFEVVPEPATMGLLALGGLAMLRRRRAA